jgi:hypothetical protein
VRHEHDASVRGAEHLRRLALEVSETGAAQAEGHLLTAQEFGSRANGDPSLPLFLLEWTEPQAQSNAAKGIPPEGTSEGGRDPLAGGTRTKMQHYPAHVTCSRRTSSSRDSRQRDG